MEEKNKMMEKLDSDTYESVVYIGYYAPKSQKQLENFLYRKPANISPLIKARKKLSEMKWLSPLPDFTGLRNIPQKSSPAPFMEYLRRLSKERISTRGDDFRLTEDDLKYIEMLIDSDFFRNSFFSDYFFETCYGIHRSRIHRDSKGKIEVDSAFYIMKNALNAVTIQSICLYDKNFGFRDLYIQRIQDVMSRYKKFDDFLDNHFSAIRKKKLEEIMLKNPKLKPIFSNIENDPQKSYYYENVVFNGFFLIIPIKLALKIISVISPSDLLSFVVQYYDFGIRWHTPELSTILDE